MGECKSCSSANRLIFACSGAADVGKIADMAARIVAKEKFGKMFCLSAIGAKLPNYIQAAKESDENIIIDGCDVACGKKIFEGAGLKFSSFILTDRGFTKGGSPASEENVLKAAATIMGKEI